MEPIKMTRAEYEAKYGTPPPSSPAPTATAPAGGAPVKMTRAEYQAKYGTAPVISPYQSDPAKKEKKGFFGATKKLAKGLFTAPATIVARPFQAAQSSVQYIEDKPKINQFKKDSEAITTENNILVEQMKKNKEMGIDSTEIKKKITDNLARLDVITKEITPTLDRRAFSGGIIAPVPENFKDVKKDVGRAAQTVALGLGPVSGGALFGAGSSVEQGNDIFSIETAFNAALGAGAGKVLDLVGKPLFNAVGKVIGKITPATLKKVAEGGTEAIVKFAEQNKFMNALVKPTAPLAHTIEKGANVVDEGVNRLFKGGVDKTLEFGSKEYPSLSKKGQQDRFKAIEEKDFAQPANSPIAGYKQATKIYNNAKKEGTNLAKVAVDNGIEHSSIIEGGKYNTLDTANILREDAMKTSHDLIRPALEIAEYGVQKVPIGNVRNALLSKVESIPASQITATERQTMKNNIMKEYGVGSAEAKAHPDGYSLTGLHDNKIAKSNNGKYKFGVGASDTLNATQSRYESDVFRKLLEDLAPSDLDIRSFNKELQKKFQLADYLESLNTKKVPQGLAQRAMEFIGKIGGASFGSQFGTLGGVAGYHIGGVFTDSFTRLPNPLKAYYLQSIQHTQPEVFNMFRQYLGDQEIIRLLQKKLPSGNKLRANYPQINLGPTQSGLPNIFGNNFKQNSQRLFNTPQLAAPVERMITPNTQGTPNPTSGTYSPGGDKGRVGGMSQRISDFYSPQEESIVAKKATELTKKNGGVTINLKGDVPSQGFAYSPYKDVETVIPQENFSQADIDNFIEKYYDRLNQEGHHLGVWIDDGKVYIDISKVNPDEGAAAADSIANN